MSVQVYCIFLFFCAASLFGTIISQANEIVASQAAVSKELDLVLEAYLTVKPRWVNSFPSLFANKILCTST